MCAYCEGSRFVLIAPEPIGAKNDHNVHLASERQQMLCFGSLGKGHGPVNRLVLELCDEV